MSETNHWRAAMLRLVRRFVGRAAAAGAEGMSPEHSADLLVAALIRIREAKDQAEARADAAACGWNDYDN